MTYLPLSSNLNDLKNDFTRIVLIHFNFKHVVETFGYYCSLFFVCIIVKVEEFCPTLGMYSRFAKKIADSSQLNLLLILVHTYAYWGLPDWKINVTINFRLIRKLALHAPILQFCNSLMVNVKSVYFASMSC